jgi:Cu-Zn family superoxide dismutase
MRRTLLAAAVAATAGGGAAALAIAASDRPAPAQAQVQEEPRAQAGQRATAVLRDAEGERVGRVVVERRGRRTFVTARVTRGVEPGFHGFHVHAVGRCEPPFTSAGGHLARRGQDHQEHVGDLPVLLVGRDRQAYLRTATDRFTPGSLRTGDGSAFMIHAAADNYANVPDRYRQEDGTAGPDEETRTTGDSGARVACGVVR